MKIFKNYKIFVKKIYLLTICFNELLLYDISITH
jgi:hypothetical protein